MEINNLPTFDVARVQEAVSAEAVKRAHEAQAMLDTKLCLMQAIEGYEHSSWMMTYNIIRNVVLWGAGGLAVGAGLAMFFRFLSRRFS